MWINPRNCDDHLTVRRLGTIDLPAEHRHFSTYGAHTQTHNRDSALLVGGASVQKATNKQAIIGVILFHTLFIVAPQAGKQLFDNAQIGEYFRVFVSYGVIALSLAMHAWKKFKKEEQPPTGGSDLETPTLAPITAKEQTQE